MKNLFDESDFDLFAQYQGKTQGEAPAGFNKLREIYNKLGKVLDKLSKMGYHTQINRNPLIQGGPGILKYSSYHWSKIYPKDNSHFSECDGKVFVVLGSTEEGVDIHLDSNSRKGFDSDKNKTTHALKNDTWLQIQPAEAAKFSVEELAQIVDGFFQDNWVAFNQFAKEFGIQKSIEILNNMNFQKTTRLLSFNHNLILTGAPGTGKTYLAKQIAQQMIFGEVIEKMSPDEEKRFNEQCGFVQFHPCYDYTDFVEGLRPIQDESGNVGFERKDGVFKDFCERALKNSIVNTIDNFEDIWRQLIIELSENDYIEIPLISGKDKFLIELNEYGDGLANRTYENGIYEKGKWVRGQSKFFSKEQCYNIYRGLAGIPSGGHDNYRKAIVNYMKRSMGLLDYVEGDMSAKTKDPYVFIIDEINRGEISKIFGELFYAIDPGYRGFKKCSELRTQYANLQKTPNLFDEVLRITDSNNCGHFFVPENVYIIGTMNDIDRSVESMDFAFRRRFAFKEMTAEESKQMLESKDAWGKDEDDNSRQPKQSVIDEINKKMDAINHIIWHKAKDGEKEEEKSIDGLSSAYHIGASYFLKLVNYKNEDGSYDYDQLWENHLEGLLLEYMRGMVDIQKKIKRLAKAFGYSNLTKYE